MKYGRTMGTIREESPKQGLTMELSEGRESPYHRLELPGVPNWSPLGGPQDFWKCPHLVTLIAYC